MSFFSVFARAFLAKATFAPKEMLRCLEGLAVAGALEFLRPRALLLACEASGADATEEDLLLHGFVPRVHSDSLRHEFLHAQYLPTGTARMRHVLE